MMMPLVLFFFFRAFTFFFFFFFFFIFLIEQTLLVCLFVCLFVVIYSRYNELPHWYISCPQPGPARPAPAMLPTYIYILGLGTRQDKTGPGSLDVSRTLQLRSRDFLYGTLAMP